MSTQVSRYEVAPYGEVGELLTGSTTRFCLIRDDGTVIGTLSGPEAHLFAAASEGLEVARFALSVLKSNPIELSEQMAIERIEAFIAKAEGRQP